MPDGLTLNKITAQRGISIGEAATPRRRSRLDAELRPGSDDLPDRLQDQEGAARPDEAGPAVLLPDAGGKGQPRLRRARCGAARRHVPQRRAALGRVDEAVPGDHPVPGDLGRPLDGDGRPPRARRGAAHRLHHADGRRVPPLDDPDEPEEVVHGELHRPGRVRHHRGRVRQVLRHHDRPPVRRGLRHRRRDHLGQRLPDGGGRDGVHQHAVRRDAVGSRPQRRLRAADRVPLGAVRREPAYRQRPLAADVAASTIRTTTCCSSATCDMRSGRTTRSSTRRSAPSSNTARRTATRTRRAMPSCGTGGSTRITTAPTCCRSRNTASRSTTTTSPLPGTASSRRTTCTRPRSSSRSAGR